MRARGAKTKTREGKGPGTAKPQRAWEDPHRERGKKNEIKKMRGDTVGSGKEEPGSAGKNRGLKKKCPGTRMGGANELLPNG